MSTANYWASYFQEGSSERQSVLGTLKQVAEASLILGALLYCAGWSYLYAYFHAFGLSLGDFDFSTESFLVFSLPVVIRWQVLATVLALYVLIRLATYFMKKSLSKEFRGISTLSLAVLHLFLAKLFSDRGIVYGEQAALQNMGPNSSLPMVSVSLKTTETRGTVCASLEDGEFRLLAHGKKLVYFVLPADADVRLQEGAQLNICSVPEDSIELIEMQTPVSSKEVR